MVDRFVGVVVVVVPQEVGRRGLEETGQLLGECLNYFFEGSERTIDTHMANLRSKIGQQWISTVRGFGYRFSGIKADSKK